MYGRNRKILGEGERKAVREQDCKLQSHWYLLLPLGFNPDIFSGASQDGMQAESLTSAV